APPGDEVLLAALGVRSTVADLLADSDGVADLLERLADPDRHVSSVDLATLYTALADHADRADLDPPDWLRVARGTATQVVRAAEVVLLDAPDLLPLLGD